MYREPEGTQGNGDVKMIMKYHVISCINHEGMDQILLILFINIAILPKPPDDQVT